jgi:hypothetical protein
MGLAAVFIRRDFVALFVFVETVKKFLGVAQPSTLPLAF